MMWLLLSAAILSWGCTGLYRRFALARRLMDIPNERSSHVSPTPRGGGVAFVTVFLVMLPMPWMHQGDVQRLVWALMGAGMLISLVGLLDDRKHIPARWRFLSHVMAAIWVLCWLGGVPAAILDFSIDVGVWWILNLLVILCLVWMLNLYNFMDGIDGIAGIEAITICIGSVVLLQFSPVQDAGFQYALLLLGFSVTGFLIWNYPRAKIFMGDAGSGFLGITLGAMFLYASVHDPLLFWGWIILLGAFIVDSTYTLMRRIMRGEPFYMAHRSHAYQVAARRFGSHVPVSLAFGLINLLWLLPISLLAVTGRMDGVFALVIAYMPLVALAVWCKAGAVEASV